MLSLFPHEQVKKIIASFFLFVCLFVCFFKKGGGGGGVEGRLKDDIKRIIMWSFSRPK